MSQLQYTRSVILKTLIIYNPKSGKGEITQKIDDICLYLKKYEVSVFYSSFEKEITSYLFLNSHRFDIVIIFGGDGTLHEAINGIMKCTVRPKILYIPSGSVNDFAKYIKINKNYKLHLALLEKEPNEIDVYEICGEYFIYTIGCGKFSNISYDKRFYFLKKYLKRFFYYFKLFKDLFVKHKYKIEIICDGRRITGYYFMFLFLAINNVAGFKVNGANNKINDGKIKLYLFKYKKYLSIISMMFFFIYKKKNNSFILEIEGKEFNIKSPNLLKLNLDGEGPFFKSDFEVKVIPNALKIYY